MEITNGTLNDESFNASQSEILIEENFPCIPYSNKFASIWRENVSHINADVEETKTVI